MTEENARTQFLKGIKVDISYYLAIQEVEYLISSIITIKNDIRENRRVVSEDGIIDMTVLEPYNHTNEFIMAVARAWNLVFGDPNVALEVFHKTSGLNNIEASAKAVMRDVILEDIALDPTYWMGVPKIAALAKHYLEGKGKTDGKSSES